MDSAFDQVLEPWPGAFDIIPGDPRSTVILHVPHSSRHIPEELRSGIVLDDDALREELDAITDTRTDLLADEAARAARRPPWRVANRVSRLVFDPERFPDDREEMNAVGMGAVYERTTTGAALRHLTADDRRRIIDRFYEPYAHAVAGLVRERLAAVGKVVIVDVHSYPVQPLPYELHAAGPRPEVCVGADSFHTTAELLAAAQAAMGGAAEVGVNSPFGGAYVPLDQYGGNPDVWAVMIEIRRDVLDERMPELARALADLVGRIERFGKGDAGAS